MIRQSAFIGEATLLKGGLHTHTTRSDGEGAPDEVMRRHAAMGYSFLAITDHRIYNHTNFAPETNLLIVPGVEVDRKIGDHDGVYCFHTVCLGPSMQDGNGYDQDHTFERGSVADQYEFQKILDEVHANNNLTFYCHPEWSGTPARDFDRLKGNFALEIWNTGCATDNDMDTNAAYWDELLMKGMRLYGVAVDDCHSAEHYGMGWVMVNAKPELNDILDALRQGAFYSTCGPEIHDFYLDGDTAIVECSPCSSISFHYGRYPTQIFRSPSGVMTRARYRVPDFYTYLRVSVRDEAGLRAWSNPIFLKD